MNISKNLIADIILLVKHTQFSVVPVLQFMDTYILYLLFIIFSFCIHTLRASVFCIYVSPNKTIHLCNYCV